MMKTHHRIVALASLIVAIALTAAAMAQSPAPIIVQAATPIPAASAKQVVAAPDSTGEAIKLLQDLKASNEETLKKQQAAVELLDRLQKDAEELRIFAKRG